MISKKVLIQWANPDEHIFRQTPLRKGCWGDVQFTDDVNDGPFDLIAVLENTTVPIIAKARQAIFIPGEPPGIRHYPDSFLKQFSTINTSMIKVWPIPQQYKNCSLNWHLGWDHSLEGKKAFWYDYDYALTDDPIKTKLCSCISSTKAVIPGHIKRLRFSQYAKNILNNELDLFGKGLNLIDDKYEALAPYKYHIAIENSQIEGYWTEKICDSIMAMTVPFYYGSSNVLDIFPKGAVIPINIDRPKEALQVIQEILNNKDDYYSRVSALKEARRLLLDEYNLFSMLANFPTAHSPYQDFFIQGQAFHLKGKEALKDVYLRGKRTVLRNLINLTYRP
jgi:hypothetical protein